MSAVPMPTVCYYCYRPNITTCDFVLAPSMPGIDAIMCNLRLCGSCAQTVALGIDWCPIHEVESKPSRGGRK